MEIARLVTSHGNALVFDYDDFPSIFDKEYAKS